MHAVWRQNSIKGNPRGGLHLMWMGMIWVPKHLINLINSVLLGSPRKYDRPLIINSATHMQHTLHFLQSSNLHFNTIKSNFNPTKIQDAYQGNPSFIRLQGSALVMLKPFKTKQTSRVFKRNSPLTTSTSSALVKLTNQIQNPKSQIPINNFQIKRTDRLWILNSTPP